MQVQQQQQPQTMLMAIPQADGARGLHARSTADSPSRRSAVRHPSRRSDANSSHSKPPRTSHSSNRHRPLVFDITGSPKSQELHSVLVVPGYGGVGVVTGQRKEGGNE